MSDERSARWNLPLLTAGQAQKEITHNEALTLLDIAVGASVVALGATVPPERPEPGACWIVGSGASGAWAGKENTLAGWTAGGWRFISPRQGMTARVGTDQRLARYDGTGWVAGEPLGAPVPLNVLASGGAVVDTAARDAIEAVHAALAQLGLVTLQEV